MNNQLKMLLLTGNESFEAATDSAAVPADLPETVEEIAAVVAEKEVAETAVALEEVQQEVEETTETVEAHSEAIEQLQEAVAGMEMLSASGVHQPAALALLYRDAYKAQMRLGDTPKGELLGAESLADVTTAGLAMRDGMESFVASIKEGIKKGGTMIAQLIQAIIDYVKALINKTEAVKRSLAQVKESLNKADVKVKEEITLGPWNVYIGYDLNQHAKAMEAQMAFGAALMELGMLTKSSEEFLTNPEGTPAAFKTAYSKIINELKTAARKYTNNKEQKAAGKTTILSSTGGVKILVTFFDGEIKEVADVTKACNATRVQFSTDKAAAKAGTKVKSKFSLADLKTATTGVDALLELNMNIKKEIKLDEAAKNKLVGLVSAAGDKKEGAAAVAAAKAIFTMSNSVVTALSRLNLNLAQASVEMIKAHVGKAEAAKPAEAAK